MATGIKHQGTVTAVGDNSITVTIQPDGSECSGCAIARMCNKAETINLPFDKPDKSMIGRKVEIKTADAAERKAIVTMLVIPIILLLISVSICVAIGLSQALAAIAAIAVMALWYVAVWLRGKQRPTGHAMFSIRDLDD